MDGSESTAAALNDLGHVAGPAQTESGYWNGALWRDGQIVDLGGIGDLGRVSDINDQDVVVGSDWGPHRAFLWRDGQRSWLAGLPDTTWSEAVAINDSEQVAGKTGAFESWGFFWESGQMLKLAKYSDLGTYQPVAINDHGQVAGLLLGLYDQSFVWNPPGSESSVASFAMTARSETEVAAASHEPLNPGGGRWNRIQDINSHGETVSMAEIAVFHGDAVVSVGDEGRRVLDFFLEDRSWDITGVRSLNDRGQILAGGSNSESGRKGVLLLTPLR